jgi:hypothetical protein
MQAQAQKGMLPGQGWTVRPQHSHPGRVHQHVVPTWIWMCGGQEAMSLLDLLCILCVWYDPYGMKLLVDVAKLRRHMCTNVDIP